jgi:hypothetical protein
MAWVLLHESWWYVRRLSDCLCVRGEVLKAHVVRVGSLSGSPCVDARLSRRGESMGGKWRE